MSKGASVEYTIAPVFGLSILLFVVGVLIWLNKPTTLGAILLKGSGGVFALAVVLMFSFGTYKNSEPSNVAAAQSGDTAAKQKPQTPEDQNIAERAVAQDRMIAAQKAKRVATAIQEEEQEQEQHDMAMAARMGVPMDTYLFGAKLADDAGRACKSAALDAHGKDASDEWSWRIDNDKVTMTVSADVAFAHADDGQPLQIFLPWACRYDTQTKRAWVVQYTKPSGKEVLPR
jgi:hypothetical protein